MTQIQLKIKVNDNLQTQGYRGTLHPLINGLIGNRCRHFTPVVMYGLLTKCEVKRAGYWPSSFVACLWTETKSRSINSQKKRRQISSHLDQINLVNKGFIIWLSGKFFFRDTAGSAERARWLHLDRNFRMKPPLLSFSVLCTRPQNVCSTVAKRPINLFFVAISEGYCKR